MKVLLLSKYPRMGASSRLRTLQYLPALSAQGVHVTPRPLFDDDYLVRLYGARGRSAFHALAAYLRRARTLLDTNKYDLVWLEKEALPYLPFAFERILLGSDTPYVVDYDDAIFHNYDRSRNLLKKALLGTKIDKVMRHAACVVAGNDYLAARARQAGARQIVIVPTVVDHTRYRPRDAVPESEPTIGWIGSPSTQVYLLDIRTELTQACRDHGARLLLVGASTAIAEAFPEVRVEICPWSEDTESKLVSRMDVGIMPLQDGPWEQGKCGYKLIQYMACGVPVIASAIGANVPIVENSGSGFLARTPQDWQRALGDLLASVSTRQSMGRRGRLSVELTYSLQAQSGRIATVLQQAAAS
jgi:glycosyltransferase involved in cell wall biosynthesis